jgi:hypothetical protein
VNVCLCFRLLDAVHSLGGQAHHRTRGIRSTYNVTQRWQALLKLLVSVNDNAEACDGYVLVLSLKLAP